MAARRQLPDIMGEALGRLSVVETPARPKVVNLAPEPAPSLDEEILAIRLSGLRLNAMAEALRGQAGRPAPGRGDFGQRLAGLVAAEEAAQAARRAAGRLKRAGLATAPGLDEVVCVPQRGLAPALLAELAAAAWVLGRRNLLLHGPTGVGKTFLAQALGRDLCQRGRGVAYWRLPVLGRELCLAARRGRATAMLRRLARLDLLILDDLGLVPAAEMELPYIYEVMESRAGRRATLLASLLPPEQWAAYLGGDHLAAALVDRLIAGALSLGLSGGSWRGRPATEP